MVLVILLQKRQIVCFSLGQPALLDHPLLLLVWSNRLQLSSIVLDCPWLSLSIGLIIMFQKKDVSAPALPDHLFLLVLWSKRPWPFDCPWLSLSMVLIMMFQKRPIVCFLCRRTIFFFFCGQSNLDLSRSPPHPSCVMTEPAKYSPIAALRSCTTLLHYIDALRSCTM